MNQKWHDTKIVPKKALGARYKQSPFESRWRHSEKKGRQHIPGDIFPNNSSSSGAFGAQSELENRDCERVIAFSFVDLRLKVLCEVKGVYGERYSSWNFTQRYSSALVQVKQKMVEAQNDHMSALQSLA